jgi:hypothetical protein
VQQRFQPISEQNTVENISMLLELYVTLYLEITSTKWRQVSLSYKFSFGEAVAVVEG